MKSRKWSLRTESSKKLIDRFLSKNFLKFPWNSLENQLYISYDFHDKSRRPTLNGAKGEGLVVTLCNPTFKPGFPS